MKLSLFPFFCLYFLTAIFNGPLLAQEVTAEERDSISLDNANGEFYRAYDYSNGLTRAQRIDIMHEVDSVYQAQELWQFSISGKMLLCNLYQWNRAYDMLDKLSNEALQIAREHLDKTDDFYGMALNLRGVALYEGKRDIEKSTNLLQESIDLGKQNGTSLLQLSRTYFNLGSFFLDAGDYDQAIYHSQKALQIELDSTNFNGAMIPVLENQLGLCFSKKNNRKAAADHFREGLKRAEAVSPQQREVDQVILYLYQNLAELYLKEKETKSAKKYINQALDFQAGQGFLKDAFTYQLQGECLLVEKKYAAALRAFQAATKSAQLEFKDFDKHPDIGLTYYHQGQARLAQGDLEGAMERYQLALINNSAQFISTDHLQNPSIDDLVNSLQAVDALEGKAVAFKKRFAKNQELGDLENAQQNYVLAIEVIEKIRQSFNAQGSKYSLSEKAIKVYEGAIHTVFELYEITGQKSWLTQGLAFAEGNKAATLLESMQGNEALVSSNIPDSLVQKEYELKLEIAFHERIIHEAKQRKTATNLIEIKQQESKLLDLRESYQKLIDFFEKNNSDYFALKFAKTTLDISAIQQKLGSSALIECFVGQERVFIFSINKETIFCEKIEKTASFDKDIKTLRTLVTTAPDSETLTKSLSDFSDLSHALYNLLLKKSLTHISANSAIDRLIIIPDDVLAFVPFAVFIEETKEGNSFSNQAYLSNRYALSYNYSIAIWQKLLATTNEKATKTFLGIAPAFAKYAKVEKLSPLACNTEEVKQIESLLNTSTLLVQEEASLENFNKKVGEYKILHLATHATLNNENSDFNKIYFSDQYINQSDLYQLKLNASLAVLSACNTGTGELLKGEGVMSLSRGFMYAGCPSILMSLWSVDDCTTSDLMYEYYGGLKNAKTKEVALQEAKQKYLSATADVLQGHPYYWAPFVQYGSTAPLDLTSNGINKYGYLLIGIVFLLGIVFFWRKSRA